MKQPLYDNAYKNEDVSDGVHGMGIIASQTYEEGSWTPVLEGGNVAGSHKMRLWMVPFASVNINFSCGSVFSTWSNVDLATNYTALAGNISANTSLISINQLGDNVGLNTVASSAVSSTSALRGQLTYQI